jgi:branched-chain amino acid transport system substrate-binding protein
MNKKALILIGVSLALIPGLVSAPPKYDRGATDAEIKISNVAPYSGPVSLYGAVGKVQAAYFKDGQRSRRYQRTQDQLHQL